MPAVQLKDRALVTVSGEEAESFLQNILTLDLATVGEGELRPGALLTPQGKILFDFLVSRLEGGFRFDVPADAAESFAKRLMLYRLRAKATISVEEEALVTVIFGGTSAESSALTDTRFPDGNVGRVYGGAAKADGTLEAWEALRIESGVAESSADYALGDAFPHDVLLDQNGGIGFRKGCYVGQEVVSRMQHRGTARRRIVIAQGDAPLPAAGSDITVEGRVIGSMGSSVNRQGLALVRIDKAKDAMDAGSPILAGESRLALSIPTFARFTWPAAADATAD